MDLGAKSEVYVKIRNIVDQEKQGVVFISSELDELITEIPEETISKDEEETIQEEVWWPELDIDFAAYEEINPDFVGILYMPLFDMRYPIALSQDNREYLTKTFEGQEEYRERA